MLVLILQKLPFLEKILWVENGSKLHLLVILSLARSMLMLSQLILYCIIKFLFKIKIITL